MRCYVNSCSETRIQYSRNKKNYDVRFIIKRNVFIKTIIDQKYHIIVLHN